jgi:transforming growth factor-beta-induced protein
MGRPDLWHRNVIELALADGRFSAFLHAVRHAGLEDLLSGPGPFILFAPIDAAFSTISQGLRNTLRGELGTLSRVVSHHVVRGATELSRLTENCNLYSLAGRSLTIIPGRILRVENARILETDLLSRNGCLVPINRLLLPKDPRETGV